MFRLFENSSPEDCLDFQTYDEAYDALMNTVADMEKLGYRPTVCGIEGAVAVRRAPLENRIYVIEEIN